MGSESSSGSPGTHISPTLSLVIGPYVRAVPAPIDWSSVSERARACVLTVVCARARARQGVATTAPPRAVRKKRG